MSDEQQTKEILVLSLIREAVGDNGKMMQYELVEHIKAMKKENERLKFLVTNARHDLFKKKLITFDEVASWQV